MTRNDRRVSEKDNENWLMGKDSDGVPRRLDENKQKDGSRVPSSRKPRTLSAQLNLFVGPLDTDPDLELGWELAGLRFLEPERDLVCCRFPGLDVERSRGRPHVGDELCV
ncbi:hypothetical protein MRX96_010247 [Rhipicephalus microplus]